MINYSFAFYNLGYKYSELHIFQMWRSGFIKINVVVTNMVIQIKKLT